jgi:Domain of unknown function (DUF4383)
MLSHAPVNHPLRPVYRSIAAVAAAATIVLGGVGFVATSSHDYFGPSNATALGLGMNPGHGLLMAATGVLVLLALLVGRNVDQVLLLFLGAGLMAVGTFGLLVMRTDINFLNYRMPNVIVAYVIGTVLFAAGLYIKSGRAAAH